MLKLAFSSEIPSSISGSCDSFSFVDSICSEGSTVELVIVGLLRRAPGGTSSKIGSVVVADFFGDFLKFFLGLNAVKEKK